MESPTEKLELIKKYFADFTSQQIQQFEALAPAYKEWNSQINVISRKDIDQIYLHHILHSLTIAAVVQWEKGTQVIDIGCGGGFPCVPLAIFFPEVKFLAVDSIAKKLKVVDAVCDLAGIKNITTQHTRVEEIKNKKNNNLFLTTILIKLNNLLLLNPIKSCFFTNLKDSIFSIDFFGI